MIKEDDEYSGVRVKFRGYMGRAEAAMQLDVGFGDNVVPAPVQVEVPTLLDLPAPRLRAYCRETTIAEKLHAMTVLGMLNGRMKDFYDPWFLSRRFSFEYASLRAAISATFNARDTAVESKPVALTQEFGVQAQERWSAFLRKSGLGDAPCSLAEVVAAVAEFLLPLLGDGLPGAQWPAGGPWRK